MTLRYTQRRMYVAIVTPVTIFHPAGEIEIVGVAEESEQAIALIHEYVKKKFEKAVDIRWQILEGNFYDPYIVVRGKSDDAKSCRFLVVETLWMEPMGKLDV